MFDIIAINTLLSNSKMKNAEMFITVVKILEQKHVLVSFKLIRIHNVM